MFAALPLILAILTPTYSVAVDHIEDNGSVQTYVVDHDLSLADCAAIRADLIDWHRAAAVECVPDIPA